MVILKILVKKLTYTLKNKISDSLPGYMIPKQYIVIDRIPLNLVGKFDHAAVQRIFKESK
jgi:acyl-CoA synthetase (AMP-forming)/AMP-acid ligase II